ncbi:MAG: lysine-epsilon-oxidase maturase LodB [Fluviicola sp.]|jgi:flavin-dependent dehydrogenase
MKNTFETDVLIVGGGPSGSSTALSLLKYSDLKVTIIEQNDLNAVRVGEQVNASVFDFLDYLGLSKNDFGNECFLPGFGSYAAWGTSNLSSRHSVFSTQVDSYQLNRELFDLKLLEKAAENGALVFPRTKALEFIETENNWLVSLKHETKGDFSVKTKYLIDASGRQSHVGRKVGVNYSKHDDLVAVGAFLHFPDGRELAQEILLETVEDGWWYIAALPSKQLVVSLFTDASIVKEKQLQKVENWTEKLSQTVHIKQKVDKAISKEKLWVRNAFSHTTISSDVPNFLAVGDAIASFDPISSMGIGFAMSSACHAAKAVIEQSLNPKAFEMYNKSIHPIFENYLKTQNQFYHMEQRWSNSPFWKKRLVNSYNPIEHLMF